MSRTRCSQAEDDASQSGDEQQAAEGRQANSVPEPAGLTRARSFVAQNSRLTSRLCPNGFRGSLPNTGPGHGTLAGTLPSVGKLSGWLGIIADRFMRLLNRIPNIPSP